MAGQSLKDDQFFVSGPIVTKFGKKAFRVDPFQNLQSMG